MNDGIGFWEGFFLLLIFVPLAILWFRTVIDIFDRRDLSGGVKALWLVAVILVPLLGTIVYLFTRPVTEQDIERAEAVEAAYQEAIDEQRRAAGFSVADELEKLGRLRDSNVLTAEEYEVQKARLLQ